MRSPQPSLALMTSFSDSSLEGFELARLDEIAQLRREMQEIHQEWIEAEVAARLARLLLEGRRMVHKPGEAESLALPDPRISAKDLPASPPALQGFHAKTSPASPLARQLRERQANHSITTGELASNLPFPAAMPLEQGPNQPAACGSVSAGRSQSATAAAPAISQRAEKPRNGVTRNRRGQTATSLKIRSTMPQGSGMSSQLPLFAEAQPNLPRPEFSRVRPVAQIPGAILCLTTRPRVPGRPTFSLGDFRAAS
jgi:hypothetical protein